MHTITCHHCGEGFNAARSDAKYCSPRCRKAASRGEASDRQYENRREVIERFDLSNVLIRNYTKCRHDMRPLYIEWLIDRAILGEAKVKAVLNNPYLLSHASEENPNLLHPTIAKLADRFTRAHWGISIHDALDTPPHATTNSVAHMSLSDFTDWLAAA